MLDMDVVSGSKDSRTSARVGGDDDDDCSTISRSASANSILTNYCGELGDAAECDVAAASSRRRRRVSWYDGHPSALMPTPDEFPHEVSLLERLRARPLYSTLTVAAVCFYCAWISRRR